MSVFDFNVIKEKNIYSTKQLLKGNTKLSLFLMKTKSKQPVKVIKH